MLQLLSLLLLAPSSLAAPSLFPAALSPVPPAVLALYQSAKGGTTSSNCAHVVDSNGAGYGDNGSSNVKTRYCGDSAKPSFVYWMSNMDVDCDGGTTQGNACSNDPSHQSETAGTTVSGKPLDAVSIPYVVLTQDKYFDPSKAPFNIPSTSPILVVCGSGGQMTWAVFGDTNGLNSMGEASIKTAQTCFGSGMTGNNGHDEADVLYIAFTGSSSFPVQDSTWDTVEFGRLASAGNDLLKRTSLGAGSPPAVSAPVVIPIIPSGVAPSKGTVVNSYFPRSSTYSDPAVYSSKPPYSISVPSAPIPAPAVPPSVVPTRLAVSQSNQRSSPTTTASTPSIPPASRVLYPSSSSDLAVQSSSAPSSGQFIGDVVPSSSGSDASTTPTSSSDTTNPTIKIEIVGAVLSVVFSIITAVFMYHKYHHAAIHEYVKAKAEEEEARGKKEDTDGTSDDSDSDTTCSSDDTP